MKMAFTYLIVLTLIMGGALAYGFIVGDFWEDGGELMDKPMGNCFPVRCLCRILLLYRLDCLPGKLSGNHSCWSVAILFGGNVVAGIYAIIALYKSKGDATVQNFYHRSRVGSGVTYFSFFWVAEDFLPCFPAFLLSVISGTAFSYSLGKHQEKRHPERSVIFGPFAVRCPERWGWAMWRGSGCHYAGRAGSFILDVGLCTARNGHQVLHLFACGDVPGEGREWSGAGRADVFYPRRPGENGNLWLSFLPPAECLVVCLFCNPIN